MKSLDLYIKKYGLQATYLKTTTLYFPFINLIQELSELFFGPDITRGQMAFEECQDSTLLSLFFAERTDTQLCTGFCSSISDPFFQVLQIKSSIEVLLNRKVLLRRGLSMYGPNTEKKRPGYGGIFGV